jgi:hypothetical protein
MFAWAAALHRAGGRQEAQQRFVEFERAARAEMEGPDNANRELAVYYTDYANRPAEAVRIMQKELTRRRDIGTRDTYAWALWKAGRRAEARKQIAEVLAVGTTDPTIRKHAATIQSAAKKNETGNTKTEHDDHEEIWPLISAAAGRTARARCDQPYC